MPIVINLGLKVCVTRLRDNSKEITVQEHRLYNGRKQILADAEKLTLLLNSIAEDIPDLRHEKIYISLSYGSGIQYRTTDIAADNIITSDRKMKNEDKENYILDTCLEYLPAGLTGRYKNWQVCVMTAYEGETDVIVSCCYIPQEFLDNIKSAAQVLGLDVVQIVPHAYGLYKMLNPGERQLIFEVPTGWLAVNQFGLACWPRPAKCSLPEKQIIEDLSATTERIFSINSALMNEVIRGDVEDLAPYFKKPVKCALMDDYVLAAAGCVLRKATVKSGAPGHTDNEKKEGKLNELTGKLRQLFTKKGK